MTYSQTTFDVLPCCCVRAVRTHCLFIFSTLKLPSSIKEPRGHSCEHPRNRRDTSTSRRKLSRTRHHLRHPQAQPERRLGRPEESCSPARLHRVADGCLFQRESLHQRPKSAPVRGRRFLHGHFFSDITCLKFTRQNNTPEVSPGCFFIASIHFLW